MWSVDTYPWLCGVEVDALDSLGPGKQLPLKTRLEFSHLIAQIMVYRGVTELKQAYLDVQTHLRDLCSM